MDREIDESVAPVREFRRQRVEREQGALDADRLAVLQRLRRLQHLELGLDVESVARLDLDRGGAAGDQRLQPRPRGLDQLVEARRARRLHRRDDAAAGRGDRLVAGAFEALLELAGPVTGEDEVGVAVDEPGRHPGAVQRLDLPGLVAGELGAAADPDDPSVGDADRAILDRAERRRHRRVHRCDVAVDEQPVPHGSYLERPPCKGKG
jgi:hypothetical protein